MSREEMEEFLFRLPPLPGVPSMTGVHLTQGQQRPGDPAIPAHPWGYHWRESGGRFPDGSLNPYSRTEFRLLHQEMEVESVRLDERWVKVSDNRGGVRHDYLTKAPRRELNCAPEHIGTHSCHRGWVQPSVASHDASGRIVHVVTNDEGDPIEIWYGEVLVARYHHHERADGVRDYWFELLDTRTGQRLLDSRALPPSRAGRPHFSVYGGVIQSVDDKLFVVVRHYLPTGFTYARLPLEEGPIWRHVRAGGGSLDVAAFVYYTDTRLRIESFGGVGTSGSPLVVEAPRRGDGAVTVSWPEDITLPVLLPDKGLIEH